MGTILGFEILERAQDDLQDPKGLRWTLRNLVDYLNDGQREVAILRPDASTSVRSIALTPLITRQTVPADCTRLIDIVRNMGGDGNTPGLPTRIIAREELDQGQPTWHTDAAASSVENYTYDGRSPKTFYVYPRPNDALQVEAHMQIVPAAVRCKGVLASTDNTAIALDDTYATALYDFVLMRARYKDTDMQDAALGAQAYQRFLQRLGLKVQTDRSFDPNRNAPPTAQKRGANDVTPPF